MVLSSIFQRLKTAVMTRSMLVVSPFFSLIVVSFDMKDWPVLLAGLTRARYIESLVMNASLSDES